MTLLLTRAPAPTIWPLAFAALGAGVVAVGVSPRTTTVVALAAVLLITAAINDLAARHAVRKLRRSDPEHAFASLAGGLQARLDRRSGAPVLVTLLVIAIVGVGLAVAGIGDNWGVMVLGVASATFGTWCLRLVERSAESSIAGSLHA